MNRICHKLRAISSSSDGLGAPVRRVVPRRLLAAGRRRGLGADRLPAAEVRDDDAEKWEAKRVEGGAEGADDGEGDGDDVHSQLELQELGDGVVDIPPPLGGGDDGGEVVVEKDDVARVLCDLSACGVQPCESLSVPSRH